MRLAAYQFGVTGDVKQNMSAIVSAVRQAADQKPYCYKGCRERYSVPVGQCDSAFPDGAHLLCGCIRKGTGRMRTQ